MNIHGGKVSYRKLLISNNSQIPYRKALCHKYMVMFTYEITCIYKY